VRLRARLRNCDHVRNTHASAIWTGVASWDCAIFFSAVFLSNWPLWPTGEYAMTGNLVRLAPRPKIELDLAILEIVQNRIGGTVATVFQRQQILHVVDAEV
jgi:hypothetical protein